MPNVDKKTDLKPKRTLRDETIPIDLSRRILAHTTMVSAAEIPHVCFEYEPDVTDFVAYFSEFKRKNNVKLSFNVLILKCIAEAMKNAPILNSHLYYKFKSSKGTLKTFEKIDVNMPVILPNGTMQSLRVQDIGAGTLLTLDAKIKDLLEKSRDELMFAKAQFALANEQTRELLKKGKFGTFFARIIGAYFGKEKLRLSGYDSFFAYLSALNKHKKTVDTKNAITKDDLREGTIVVSNVGSIKKDLRGRVSMFEIIPPQVFAVMVCNLQRQPVVVKDADGSEKVEIKTVLPMNLAFDHRACDFGDLVPFIEKMDEIFAHPEIIDSWI